MKKIVVINHYGQTPDTRGTTRHLDMAIELSKYHSAEVELWVCGNNRQLGTVHKSLKGKILSKEKYENITIVRIRSISEKKQNGFMRQLNISLFSFISGLMILFGKKKDLFILSVPPLSFFNALMIKLRNSKLIVDVEDLWPLFLQDLGLKNRYILGIMEQTANYLYNTADAIDTVSEKMKEFVEEKLIDKSKLVWISPLGVNVEKYYNAKKANFNYQWKGKFSIIYAGAHGKANGLKTILDAAKNLIEYEDIAFIFVGDGAEKQFLIEYAKENNLNNVFFEDAIPSSHVPSVLKLSDVCITHLKNVNSFKFVRPNKIFEYMAVSRPIICGIHGEAKNIVNEANAGICVEPENAKEISDAVLELYYDRQKSKQMGINGYYYIEKFGDRKNILKEYCVITDEILKKNM